jgi:hypothetical protein
MFIPHLKWICLLLLLSCAALPVQSQDITPVSVPADVPAGLVVAWVDSGDLYIRLREAAPKLLASGEVVRPYIAPDGKQVAFTRGQGGLPETLWVTDVDGQAVRELAVLENPADDIGTVVIGQVDWLDESTLYFNTAHLGSLGPERQDDLWHINIEMSEVTMLLPAGEGGAFSLSPDRQHLALIQPGLYGETQGHIRLMDTQTNGLQAGLSFDAVSTGAEYRFYPEVFWEADNRAIRVAIPDKDLIYAEETSPPTALWRVPVEGSPEQIGSVEASFFGLPRWSDDGANMVYLTRKGSPASNQFDLMSAGSSGENAVLYDTGAAGSFGMPTWIPDATQFIYPQGKPNQYWLGSPDTPPRPLAERLVNPQFVDSTRIVYAAVSGSAAELRYLQLDNGAFSLIATLNSLEWVFDARIVE